MANRFVEPTSEQKIQYQKYLTTIPHKARTVANQFDAWTPYRLKSNGQVVLIHGWGLSNNGDTIATVVPIKRNKPLFSWNTVSVHSHDLEETDIRMSLTVYDGDYYLSRY